jgi:23S rRNA (uracil1939-C5)-methyltransferase
VSRLDCPKQARCPGCPLGDQPYEAGLQQKAHDVARAFASYAELAPELAAARAATPTREYRLRAKLVVDGKALGLYERGSHRVVDVTGCRVLSPALTSATETLRRALPLPVYGADLRESSEGVLLTLLSDDAAAHTKLERAARQLLEQGLLSVSVSVRSEGNVRLLAGEPKVVAGPSTARHRLSAELPYAYAAPGGFVQAHAGQASYVQAEVIARLRERWATLQGRRVLELFAGNGGLALALAREGAAVTAVESYAPAIELAERAGREQSLRVRAIASDAARFAETAARTEQFDAAIVNPPRRGLAPALRAALARLRLETVAYVSCNPRTLARDCWQLALAGLRVKRVEPLDMIPWSDAVEALAWLEPAPAPAARVLFENEAWLALEKHAGESIISADSAEPSLLARARAAHGAALTPVDGWGSGVSGVCWFAKTSAAEPALRRALARAERELVVLVRGNLRKQGTITRPGPAGPMRGARYKKQRDIARHSLASALSFDDAEVGTLRDFASISHPVLGDARHGDRKSNDHIEHRHGLDRPFVHCRSVSLCDETGREHRVSCELSPDLEQVLGSLVSD